MAQSLKQRFEQIAKDQTRDPSVEVVEKEIRVEKPVPGSGWGNSGHTGGGHTGHDGKFRPNKTKVEVHVEREERKKPPPPQKSLSDLP